MSRVTSVLGQRRAAVRGFTLLEVLVAVAILGLGLTVVLSAQTGVFWSYSRATRLSQAPGLVRCKMAEIELELLEKGYPLLDEQDQGECCEDVDLESYSCAWKIEKVEMPELSLDTLGGSGADAGAFRGEGDLGGDPLAGGSPPGAGGPLGTLATLQTTGAQGLSGGGIGDLAGMMGESGGVQGMASMVMAMVYPDLKPMLEASVRKITVTVSWQEGVRERDLSVTQFVTSPQQGGFDPLADEGVDEAAAALPGALGLPGAGGAK